MYKHRSSGQRGVSPGIRAHSSEPHARSGTITRTPSPLTTTSDGYLDRIGLARRRSTLFDSEFFNIMSQSSQMGPVRSLAAQVMSTIISEHTQSAPAVSNEGEEYPFTGYFPLAQGAPDDLKTLYLETTSDFYGSRRWMEAICSVRMPFLSHVSVICVFQDLEDGLLEDSSLTVYAKTKLLRMIQDSLRGSATQTDDFTVLSILHLLTSEVGGFDEDAFDVHQAGLIRIVQQRGGINNLGFNGDLASVVTSAMLCFTTLRGVEEPVILHDFIPIRTQPESIDHIAPLSPLYCPGGDMSPIFGTLSCSSETYEILYDMHELTRTFILRWSYTGDSYAARSPAETASYDAYMQQICTRAFLRPSQGGFQSKTDWIYESCRLAALIYCQSLVQGVPLSESTSSPYTQTAGNELSPDTYLSQNSGYTVILALHNAIENTDKSAQWEELCGVFLWITLVGAAASWQTVSMAYGETDEMRTRKAWTRKCFALYSVKVSLVLGFEQPGAVVEAQRTMLQVQRLANLKRGIRSQ
ncbi:hypothetical protein GQ43DRAFT_369463 [Delitschia confertaspora ATCC 74209]|uniref:Transcription factor domain-containing protein n=1 Tax=Delitschia confertaspora ATCC 74209 TaxID=1513339 RepID=A0A9P4MZV8_9PLEO|nr:hypothetical protein GQ43DRAFT_369463 [Delitschia confertaspora ATCC 74209]